MFRFFLCRIVLPLAIILFLSACAQNDVKTQPGVPPLNLHNHIEASIAYQRLVVFGIPLLNQAVLQEFYVERNFQPAWHDANQRLTPQALGLIEEISRIGSEGLLPQDYHYKRLKNYADQQATASPNYVEYDLLISDAAFNLTRHLLMGKVDPERISTDWSATRRQRDLVDVVERLTDAKNINERLLVLRPRQVRYFRMRRFLENFDLEKAPKWQALARHPSIRPNEYDRRLVAIRERLVYWGDLNIAEPLAHPEFYDEELVAAIEQFQARHGLDTDGVIGPKTIDALNVTPAERRQTIINNMERWRWLAKDFGEKYVLVNIAGFELKVIDRNETVMRKPVIVGRDYRRTPVFSDHIRYIVFNPSWTVPFKLIVRDKLPDIQADPDYLTRMGFTVYDHNQNPVDPASVDWKKFNTRNFPYQLVQGPGPYNALGQVKFMFPNAHDVYLHDTPSRELFRKSDRAFSSGCVRVAEPLDLAAWLLKDNGLSRRQIDEIVAKGKLRTVFLKNPIPVHIEYWTAWADSQDQLNFRNDIYERDPPLAAALAAPLYPE